MSRPKVPPAYLAKLVELYGEGALPAGLHVVEVCHDDWCDLLNGRGECNCEPEIERPERLQ